MSVEGSESVGRDRVLVEIVIARKRAFLCADSSGMRFSTETEALRSRLLRVVKVICGVVTATIEKRIITLCEEVPRVKGWRKTLREAVNMEPDCELEAKA